MNKKNLYRIILGIALSTLPTFAADEIAELRSQLDTVTQRLGELEGAEKKPDWTDKVHLKADVRIRYAVELKW